MRAIAIGAVVMSFAWSGAAHLLPLSRAELTTHTLARGGAVVVVDVERSDTIVAVADLVTDHVVRVRDVLAGTVLDDVLVVRTDGGALGDVVVMVEDEAALAVGQRAVLFVGADGGALRVVGGVLGVIDVAAESPAAVRASLTDPEPRRPPVARPRVRPLFDADGPGWGAPAIAEAFSLAPAGFADIIDGARAQARFEAALSTWTREGGAAVTLRFGGTTSDEQFGGGNDDQNITHRGSSTLSSAIASARTTTSGGRIVDCDIRIFERNIRGTIPWSAADAGATADELDVEQTRLHELGHCLGLGHSDVDDAIMAASTAGGSEDRRRLRDDDMAGVQALYGVGAPSEGEGEG